MRADPNRLVTLWCPDWPMAATGIAGEIPAAVLRANRVVARTPAAGAEGVRIGQRRREAQKRCPDLRIVDHDPDRDAAAFEPIARAVTRFTPRLEIVDAGWACFAARGPARYFGGEAAFLPQLLEHVAAAAREVGPVARVAVGVADGRFASTVAARRAGVDPLVVEPGGSAAFLGPLPIDWLHHAGEATVELVELFARLGLTDLAAVAGLDATDVLARFGVAGRHAHRLAAGLDERGTDAVAPPEALGAEVTFDAPVLVLDPLVFRAKVLADDLAGRLADNGLVCTRLVVTAETDHGERDERAWYRAAGMGPGDLVERVRWQLAGWMASGDLSAGVTFLRLAPEEVRANDGEQRALWGGSSAADDRAVRAVARLTSLVGDQGVLVPVWVGGRLPADRCHWTAAAAVDLLDPRDVARRLGPLAPVPASTTASSRAATPVGAPWPGSLPAPSPMVVLPEPSPAVLADDAGRPVRVTGRGDLSGEPVTLAVADRVPRLVVGWAGPWIVDERWWDLTGRRRVARLQVVCDDGAAHLVVAEHQRWWLLAAYR